MNQALKLSVLYGHPTDPAAFEAYYLGTHLPLAAATPGLGRTEMSKGLPGPTARRRRSTGCSMPGSKALHTWPR